jgi:TolB-like protein/cytochrome c-type biogenesis protein CcmH/NrfG
MSKPSKAVFLSYASEDAEAAARIAEALKAAGLEVWFDKGELRGGDAWDAHIREQIQTCRLFLAIISVNTNARDEGYFRREWRLAVDRTLDMDEKKAFLFPVIIDGTSERTASVPAAFRKVQWTWLSEGETLSSFVAHVAAAVGTSSIIEPGGGKQDALHAAPIRHASSRRRWLAWASVALIALAAGFWIWHETFVSRSDAPAATASEKSLAVLPFVDMSEKHDQGYFADGLSEELCNSLARVKQLQVVARTSSFSFKGNDVDIATIARKLNVRSVLEGSVRRMGNRMRISAQLINAITGYHLWSQTYERDLSDVFRLQSEIATAVSGALRVTLLADDQERLAPGGTRNAQAFDAYLRGRYGEAIQDEAGLRGALAALDEAVALDSQFAQALAFRADVMTQVAGMYTHDPKERDHLFATARTDVQKAVILAPQSALAWSTLGTVLSSMKPDYVAVDAAYRRSLELEPGNAEILHTYASYAAAFGRPDALIAARRAVNLDPLDLGAHANLGVVLYYAHQFAEARAAFQEALRLGTNRVTVNWLGINELASGHAATALRYCTDKDDWADQLCLAIAYQKLGRQHEAASLLEKMIRAQGDDGAYQYVEVYASWGEIPQAMQWLKRAIELQDAGLLAVKTDPLLAALRKAPGFDALVAQVGLPAS